MGSFAAFLKRKGIVVTGSDQNVYPPMSDVLKNAGVELFSGYRAENLTGLSERPDLVVIGNVIGRSNPEAEAAISGGYAYTSLPEAMERLMLPQTRNLVVSGTHGKTTTASLLAFVLSHAGREPNYFIGGVSHDLPNSFHISSIDSGRYFVLEGDEYDTAFWDKVPKFNHYLPDDAILTSVEFDHADIYSDLAAVKRAFSGLILRIRPGGKLIACADYETVRELAREAKVPVIFYGSETPAGAQYSVRFTHGVISVDSRGMTHFDVLENGKAVGSLQLNIPGKHNVLNALSVWIECRELGLSRAEIEAGLAAFKGVKRRQEERGEVNGVLVIDDFAHHPTAVRETLRALRAKYVGRRITAVFEPRSATSRRKIFQQEYGQAFREADSSFIAVPYDQSKIPEVDQFSSEQLVADIQKLGKAADFFQEVDEGVQRVAYRAKKGDLIAVLSNGGFGGFIPKLLAALQARSF